MTPVARFEGVTGGGWGADTGLGLEVFRCFGSTSFGGFGFGRLAGPACGVGVGAVTCFFSSFGVAAW